MHLPHHPPPVSHSITDRLPLKGGVRVQVLLWQWAATGRCGADVIGSPVYRERPLTSRSSQSLRPVLPNTWEGINKPGWALSQHAEGTSRGSAVFSYLYAWGSGAQARQLPRKRRCGGAGGGPCRPELTSSWLPRLAVASPGNEPG